MGVIISIVDRLNNKKNVIPTGRVEEKQINLLYLNQSEYNVLTYSIFDSHGNEYKTPIEYNRGKPDNTTLAEWNKDYLMSEIGYQFGEKINIKNAINSKFAVIAIKCINKLGVGYFKHFLVTTLGEDYLDYQKFAYQGLTFGYVDKKYLNLIQSMYDVMMLKIVAEESYDLLLERLGINFVAVE